jgi:Domain of unknown function (DUF4349)
MKLTDDQIGAELVALRATPSEDFAATLDRRVAAGFPAERTKTKERELTWSRLLPALGALAAVALVVVVITNSGSGGGTNAGGGESISAPTTSKGVTGSAAGQAAPSESVVPQTAAPPISPLPPIGGRPHNGHPQVQEQSASLGLSTDAGKLQDAADGVVQVTDRYDGFVDSSTVHAGGANGHASFSLRIPTVHLQDALADLSDLGHVTSRDEGSTNVTGAYTDAGKAYRLARAKVDSLLEDLRNASSPSEAASIKQRLVAARDQLAAARAGLRGLKQRVALTPVSVEITAHGDGNWSIGDAADDAVGVLEAIGGALLIALAVLVPLAALCALGWLGARELSRRRREAPLDG